MRKGSGLLLIRTWWGCSPAAYSSKHVMDALNTTIQSTCLSLFFLITFALLCHVHRTFTLHILKHHFLGCRSLITGFHAKCQPVWIFTWEWQGNAAVPVMTNECWAWLVACLLSMQGVCSRPGCMKSSVWPWDGRLKLELPPPHLNVRHLKKSEAPPLYSFLFVRSFSPLYLSIHPWSCPKKKVGKYHDPPLASPPSSPPTSTIRTYRTFDHWTLNSFLVFELGEYKHNQRGRKNKSVIARDSLCQHLSRFSS